MENGTHINRRYGLTAVQSVARSILAANRLTVKHLLAQLYVPKVFTEHAQQVERLEGVPGDLDEIRFGWLIGVVELARLRVMFGDAATMSIIAMDEMRTLWEVMCLRSLEANGMSYEYSHGSIAIAAPGGRQTVDVTRYSPATTIGDTTYTTHQVFVAGDELLGLDGNRYEILYSMSVGSDPEQAATKLAVALDDVIRYGRLTVDTLNVHIVAKKV